MKKSNLLALVVVVSLLMGVASSAGAQTGLPPTCSGVQLQNTSATNTAEVTISFYKQGDNDGVANYVYPVSGGLVASASKSFYIPSILPSSVPSGIYAAVVSASEKLNSLVNQTTCAGSSPYVGASHSGVDSSDAGSPVYMPFVLSRAYPPALWSSALAIQNAGTGDATSVVVQFFAPGNPTPVASFTNTSLKLGETWYLDLGSGTYATPALNGFAGAAMVTSNQAVAVVVNYAPANGSRVLSYNGVVQGGQTLYSPQITKHFAAGDYTGGLTLYNPNGTSTPIRVKYIPAGASTPVYTQTATIGANGVFIQYLGSIPNANLANGFNGTAVVEVTSGANAIVGISNLDSAAGQAGAINMIPLSKASSTLYLPQIVRTAFGGYESGWQVVNTTGTNLNLTIEYWRDNNTLTFTDHKSLLANSALTNYVGSAAFAGTLGTGWNGGVVIKVDGGVNKIVGQGNFVAPAAGDGLLIYNAFPGN